MDAPSRLYYRYDSVAWESGCDIFSSRGEPIEEMDVCLTGEFTHLFFNAKTEKVDMLTGRLGSEVFQNVCGKISPGIFTAVNQRLQEELINGGTTDVSRIIIQIFYNGKTIPERTTLIAWDTFHSIDKLPPVVLFTNVVLNRFLRDLRAGISTEK